MQQNGGFGRRLRDRRERGADAFEVAPFNRLARTHVLSVAGDTLLAIALADSLFFDVDPNDARWRVGAYLLLTIAPFAIVAPFLGPVMDRISGGHRYMIIGTAACRALLMAALVIYVKEWALFPLAFAMLVMGKTYAVAKSAVVPTTVDTEEALVRSNSRLSILSAVSGAAAGVPGVLLLRLGGAPWVLSLGVAVFVAAAVMGFRIPATKVAAKPVEQAERAELKRTGILVASSAMGYLRGAVGFVTMLLAFDLRGGIDPGPTSAGVEIGHQVRESLGFDRLDLTSGGSPPWHFGVALIGVGLGGLLGSASVPRIRAAIKEERILAYALIALTALATLAALSSGLVGAFIMSFAIALAAQGGKQAFDAIVQRDAPRANLGRTFSRYESRFQLIWVLGALLPVIIPLLARVGYILVAVTAAFVAATYWFGRTPNPAAIVSDGIMDDGLDRLADVLPGGAGRRLSERTWGRRVADDGPAPDSGGPRFPHPDHDTATGGNGRGGDAGAGSDSGRDEGTGPRRRAGGDSGVPTTYDPDRTHVFDDDAPTLLDLDSQADPGKPGDRAGADAQGTTDTPADRTSIYDPADLPDRTDRIDRTAQLDVRDGEITRPPQDPDSWPNSTR